MMIVRISEIEVYPEYLTEYVEFAHNVGATSVKEEPGVIMLYTSNQLCIFFDSNSWQYTRIGKIEGMTAQQVKDVFGTGEVSITLSLDATTGIVSASANKAKKNNIYGINGQKLADVPTKGMYIENGVKKLKE